MDETRAVALADKIPAHFFFMISAVFHYLGPAFAVLLFDRVGVLGVAWLRIASAAFVFALWRRPWLAFSEMPQSQRQILVALGITLGLMNACFYLAISRIPLGTVGAIEFIGPICLAALGIRSWRNIVALILAASGGLLLTEVRFEGEPLGFFFAFANSVLFLLYIVLGHRIAKDGGAAGIDRLGGAMLVALVVITPVGLSEALPVMTVPILLLAGIGVGICSSVIPYVTDQLAMARLPRSTFALLLSLLPAFGLLIGFLVLRQIPTAGEIAGVLLVASGVSIHDRPDP